MNPHKLIRTGSPLLMGLALVALLWMTFSPKEAATAYALPEPVILSENAPHLPQPEWINLLKSQHAQSDNPAEGLTFNINLTDDSVAGHTPLPASITISVTRAGELLGYQSVLPVLDPPGFFYQIPLDFMDYPLGPCIATVMGSEKAFNWPSSAAWFSSYGSR